MGIKGTSSIKELVYIYSGVDIFLNLSYCENYPTVNLEASACGIRVLTYDVGGSPESAGEDCIVVEKGNINQVVEEIKKIKEKCYPKNKVVVMDKQTTIKFYLKRYQNMSKVDAGKPNMIE